MQYHRGRVLATWYVLIRDNLIRWIDNEANLTSIDKLSTTFNWIRCIPLIALHISCLGVIWVGVSPIAVYMAIGLYLLRMLAVTGFYHRYFSHRTFKTSRAAQFIFALIGCTAVQRGPLWWAGHHRSHHQYSDTERDIHSPRHGFLWSHMGWFACEAGYFTKFEKVQDLAKFPELRFLNRYDNLVPICFAVILFCFGHYLNVYYPAFETSGAQLLVWGFCISTVALLHGTLTINSLSHKWGTQRFDTGDDSRNNWVLAMITLGEGWHNNHHRYPHATRQGFYWWEIDLTYYVLKVLSWLHIIWDLKPVPRSIRAPVDARMGAPRR